MYVLFNLPILTNMLFILDFQKLEREARICRKLHHPNIGMMINIY